MKKGQITNVMEPFVSIIAAISLYDVLLTYNWLLTNTFYNNNVASYSIKINFNAFRRNYSKIILRKNDLPGFLGERKIARLIGVHRILYLFKAISMGEEMKAGLIY